MSTTEPALRERLYYEYALVYESDAAMATCLREGGRWTAQPCNSREARAARRAGLAQKLSTLQGNLDSL